MHVFWKILRGNFSRDLPRARNMGHYENLTVDFWTGSLNIAIDSMANMLHEGKFYSDKRKF